MFYLKGRSQLDLNKNRTILKQTTVQCVLFLVHGADANFRPTPTFLFPIGGEFTLHGAPTPSRFESKVQQRLISDTQSKQFKNSEFILKLLKMKKKKNLVSQSQHSRTKIPIIITEKVKQKELGCKGHCRSWKFSLQPLILSVKILKKYKNIYISSSYFHS